MLLKREIDKLHVELRDWSSHMHPSFGILMTEISQPGSANSQSGSRSCQLPIIGLGLEAWWVMGRMYLDGVTRGSRRRHVTLGVSLLPPASLQESKSSSLAVSFPIRNSSSKLFLRSVIFLRTDD